MQLETKPNKLVYYLVHLLCCAFLLIPAFYNGYGIVNSDFGTYLPSGFKPDMPVDRPITYGILLRVFSLNGLSMWLVLVAQGFFVSNLIVRLVKYLLPGRNYLLLSVMVIVFLSLCTGLSWTTSQLQPDIYTPIALMCAALLLITNESKQTTILTCVLYFIAVGAHASHLVLFFLLLLVVVLFFRKSVFKEKKKRVVLLFVLSVAPILTMLPIFSKSGHVFFMGSLLEKGILKNYLDEHCAAKNYKLCTYKDDLPIHADDFLWESYSPVYKEGGWAAVKPEYNEIISDVRSTPKYIGQFAVKSFEFTLIQLTLFEIGPGNVPFKEGTYVYDGMKQYVPDELQAFASSKQSDKTLLSAVRLQNKIFSWVMLFSSALLLMLLVVRYKSISPSLRFFIILSISTVLLNAWDCATFSVLNGRYGCRIMWVLPFCMLLQLFSLRKKKA